MVLPRTLVSRFRLTQLFYRITWPLASWLARRIPPGRIRDSLLASYGPLSLIALISWWATVLIVGFACLGYGVESMQGVPRGFFQELYLSGTTFFTLGLGDEKPQTAITRVITFLEAGIGFGTLAIVIGYLPVLYQAFARRELNIVLLASRAGYPSTAAGLLTRLGRHPDESRLLAALSTYEQWCAEVMENHSSYPMLAHYRSQHERQSWLASLTMLLDTCAVLQVGFENHPEWHGAVEDQAELTFAMGCRAVVKLTTLIQPPAREGYPDRLQPARLAYLARVLSGSGLELRHDPESVSRLNELRQLYEPQVFSIARHLLLDIPPFVVESEMFESTTPESAVRDAEET
ncbi:K+ channel, pore region [Fimbriimonas ginsengisoli Gsoil 348]|uniref:K+ channel, pore region n=2 Tax=Fimbriimonas ginsengisoli TaxID=1005039 RepID=A0A068NVH1_FIMGI|nr:K+ channel, pore region [Fimbriimonas ginsengisoli Gsoil 348]